jgi:hypothetical protein
VRALLQINSPVGAQSQLEDERGIQPRSDCDPMKNITASISGGVDRYARICAAQRSE